MATLRRFGPWIFVLLLVLIGAVRGAGHSKTPGDFLRYHRAGRMVVTDEIDHVYEKRYLRKQLVYAEERAAEIASGRERPDPFKEREFKYLPATAVYMAPFGALHPRTASSLWSAWIGLLVGITFWASWSLARGNMRAAWLWLPCIALARSVNDNMNLEQLNPSAIAPATLAVVLLARRHDVAAGVCAAIGGVIKFMPAFLVIWLAWKRRWKAVGAMIATIAAFGWGLPALVLGPGRATHLTLEYFDVRTKYYTESASPDLPGHSIKSFVYRVFGETPYMTSAGTGGRKIEYDISLVHLPPQFLFWSVIALALLVVVVVLRRCPPPVRTPPDPRAALEAGAFMVVLLLISPEARAPHFLYLTLPAIALTYGLVDARRRMERPETWWKICVAASVTAAFLVNTDSTTFVKDLAFRFSAWCALGWASLIVLIVLLTLLSRLPKDGAEPSTTAAAT